MSKRILVIDDDPLVLKTLKNLLVKNGYNILAFKDSEQAMSQMLNDDFDLILCDVRMPGLDGIELISQFNKERQKNGRTETPVIFITGYASQEAPIKALKLKAKDYILKPFDLDKLLKAVKDALK